MSLAVEAQPIHANWSGDVLHCDAGGAADLAAAAWCISRLLVHSS
jgi:hypothetical protein